MEATGLGVYEYVCDLAGLFICVLTALCVLAAHRRSRNERVVVRSSRRRKLGSARFTDVMEQVRDAGEHGETVLMEEAGTVPGEIGDDGFSRIMGVSLQDGHGREPYGGTTRATRDTAGDPCSAGTYAEASRLATMGTSIDGISARLKIPRGEVELAVKLHGMKQNGWVGRNGRVHAVC